MLRSVGRVLVSKLVSSSLQTSSRTSSDCRPVLNLAFTPSIYLNSSVTKTNLESLTSWDSKLNSIICFLTLELTLKASISSLNYLGFKVSEGVKPIHSELVPPILEFLILTISSQVKPFLGFVQFYGQFIKDLSWIAATQIKLRRQNVDFTWIDGAKHHILGPSYCGHDPSLPLPSSPFDFNIVHVKGIHSLHTDALSQSPLDDPEPFIIPDSNDELMCLPISSACSSDNELLAAVKKDVSLFALPLKQQEQVTGPRPINLLTSRAMDEIIALMIAIDFQPYFIVEDSGFRRFKKMVNPKPVLPSRKLFQTQLVLIYTGNS
ncbi:unnamed protein product [Lepeophtheirus salmonis]|uniref:(salmon louse) hypothetical protein n=1 Tax=Lepeophtheirus salmonis TaxID=72036 RepID=A0A7R8CJK4_LEPSM|nr:unnamed protein product [Lepeophtheirus salmonis]CAF2806834.1 unnamed protein product [Lepeophtheirus salmonis]